MAGMDVRLIVMGLLLASQGSLAKVQHKVRCEGDEWMTVELVRPEDTTAIYLDQMRGFPDESCQPVLEEGKATFRLPLKDVFRCGVTRVYNSLTDTRVYHHKIVMESKNSHGGTSKEIVFVKCIIKGVTRSKRNVLPAGFKEPEVLDITTSLTEYAPEPLLSAGVRQGGRPVTGELSVSPGASLQLEISLDPVSAPVYGLLVGHLAVSDTKTQEETIIFNGCSVDPYLFENFNTVDGDLLTAKFRAFKFPESSYVQFKGTVNVCLDKCKGVKCSNGQLGYGRRRRAVSQLPADPNKVFEVSMSTLIKVDYDGKDLFENGKMSGSNANNITFLNGMEPRSFTVGIIKDEEEREHLHRNNATVVREEFVYKVFEEQVGHASALCIHWALMCFVAFSTLANILSW
ncbi:uncharacterized protein LOC124169460 [Ischnura elegans]|uniref:uncharacterized protein LOC124169460 n=1 Tax=Ischnura elegans TaxID=197161 RepID=UPI001ED88BCE|nr:uncharacterized protein LOC124169460 [Ischnura elegans]